MPDTIKELLDKLEEYRQTREGFSINKKELEEMVAKADSLILKYDDKIEEIKKELEDREG